MMANNYFAEDNEKNNNSFVGQICTAVFSGICGKDRCYSEYASC